jgi:mercuric ion binding protein
MKNIKMAVLSTLVLLAMAFTHAPGQIRTDTIKVSGNCNTCKQHIEKAAKKAGAEKANWNKDTKVLVVSYSTEKSTNDEIQKKVASAGYDTEKYTADEKAYKNLDECCQYDRKKAQ